MKGSLRKYQISGISNAINHIAESIQELGVMARQLDKLTYDLSNVDQGGNF